MVSFQGVAYFFSNLCSLLVTTVEDLLVVIHPDLGQPYLVTGDHLSTFRKGVWTFGAEHMTDNGAWNDLQLPSTLPHLQVRGRPHAIRHTHAATAT